MVDPDHSCPQHQGMSKHSHQCSQPKHHIQNKPEPPPCATSTNATHGIIAYTQNQTQQEALAQHLSLADHINSHRLSQQA